MRGCRYSATPVVHIPTWLGIWKDTVLYGTIQEELPIYCCYTEYLVNIMYNMIADSTGIFVVWKDDESCREFIPGPKGLYCCDCSKVKVVLLATNDDFQTSDTKINTVKNNMKQFNQRYVKHATVSRKFQDSVGLTTKALIRSIDNKLMNNSPITRESIKHANSIWGPSTANLKGKSTQT